MDSYIGQNKLATYLHPGPTGPFLELKSEPTKPPSPITSALLRHNPSLIDLCTFNSLCERLMENSSSSSPSPSSSHSSYKPLVNPTELNFLLPPVTKLDCTEHSPVTSIKSINPPETPASPITSVGECSPNVSSYSSTPYASPKQELDDQSDSPLVESNMKVCSIIQDNHQQLNSTSKTGNCETAGKIRHFVFHNNNNKNSFLKILRLKKNRRRSQILVEIHFHSNPNPNQSKQHLIEVR